jgi:hypothetical protein
MSGNVVYQIQKWKNNSWCNEFSSFSPLSEGDVTYKTVSDDEVATGTFKFFDIVLADQICDIKIME